MKAYSPIKGYFSLILLTLTLSSWAQQEDVDSNVQEPVANNNASVNIPFIAPPKMLAKEFSENDLSWINVLNQEHLVIKRKNKGRIYRGNAIFFHTPGENPIHNRLNNPLSIQLANLGWNTFSTNIGFPDFPLEAETNTSIEQNQSSQQDSVQPGSSLPQASNQNESEKSATLDESKTELKSETSKIESFFKTKESYQEYYALICQATLKLVTISNQPTIFVANGEAAYWLLSCLEQISPQTPIVFIQPKAPIFAHDDIESTLQSFRNPVFAFSVKNNEDYFVKLIKQQNWQSPNQRFSQSVLLNPKINIENTIIGKLITGWAKTISSPAQ